MEASELIASVLPNMRCKGRNCTGVSVSGFEFGKGHQITACRGIFELFYPKRLEGTQSLRPAPQHQVTYRSTPEFLHFRRDYCANANAGAQLLIGGFQSCCNVDGVALGCVVEKATATEIPHDRRPTLAK